MPICKKCGDSFPYRITIQGKVRHLNSRKYCLTCSPFGGHNTRPLEECNEIGTCKYCGRKFNYYMNGRNKGHRRHECGSCITVHRRRVAKEKAVAYKGGKCESCGYHKCIGALEFHHKNPEDKDFSVASSYLLSWEKLRKELDKCVMLCANCHREIHEKEDK